jgi:hypothetical protein
MAKHKRVLEEHNDREDSLDFYEGATNNQTYLEPNCSDYKNETFADM